MVKILSGKALSFWSSMCTSFGEVTGRLIGGWLVGEVGRGRRAGRTTHAHPPETPSTFETARCTAR